MLMLSNDCGNAIQNGIDIRANSIASPIETMIKSISQATNRSIHLANTTVSVSVISDDDGEVVCVIVVVVFLLSSATTMTPAIRTIIPLIVRTIPAHCIGNYQTIQRIQMF